MNLNVIAKCFAITLFLAFTHQVAAQDTQYGQGLFLDFYVIQNVVEDIKEPTGRSMATLVDTSAPNMSYLSPFEIEPALEQFQDKLWGLHWTGFLKVDSEGPHTFNLMIETTATGSGWSHSVHCQSWFKIQDRLIANHELQEFHDGTENAYGDLELKPGIYETEVWFACNEVGGAENSIEGASTSISKSKPTITLNMRGPNDAMLRPIPKNQLLHEL